MTMLDEKIIKSLQSLKKNCFLYLVSGIALFLASLFFICFGYAGLKDVQLLIASNNIGYNDIFEIAEIFLKTTIAFSLLSSFLSIRVYNTIRKISSIVKTQ